MKTSKITQTDEEILNREFDFSKAIMNPYAKQLKKTVTINLSPIVIEYFKKQAAETSIPYQSLINLYLMDCVKEGRKLNVSWV